MDADWDETCVVFFKLCHLLNRDDFCPNIQSYLYIFNRWHNLKNTTQVSSQSASIVGLFGNKIQT
jgi:hypothetical protein